MISSFCSKFYSSDIIITLLFLMLNIYKLIKKEELKIKTLRIYGFNNITIISKYLLLHFIISIKAMFFGIILHKVIVI